MESHAVQAVPVVASEPTQCTISEFYNVQVQYEPQFYSEQKLTQIVQSKEYAQFIQNSSELLVPNLVSNHVGDAEFALSRDQEDYDAKSQSNLSEIQSFQHKYSKNKTVTCFKTVKYQKLTLIFQALAPVGFTGVAAEQGGQEPDGQGEYDGGDQQNRFVTLVWNIADNMQPVGCLVQPAACTALDVVDSKGHLAVVMGTYCGQVLFYDLDGVYRDLVAPAVERLAPGAGYNQPNRTTFGRALEGGLANVVFQPTLQSAPASFHNLPVTDVRWLPQNSQITATGELQTSANRFGSVQFASVSPDGYVKVYRLDAVDRDGTRGDLVALRPFLAIPAVAVYPAVRRLKPLSIQFTNTDVPSSLVLLGDVFGRVGITTWTAAVAGVAALDQERKRLEKQYTREMNDQTQANIEHLSCFATDFPTKGTFVTGFQYFQTGVFRIEFSPVNGQFLLLAAADGVKLLTTERKLHRQTFEYALRGLVEEEAIFQYNHAQKESLTEEQAKRLAEVVGSRGQADGDTVFRNFCVVKTMPPNSRPFDVDDKPQD